MDMILSIRSRRHDLLSDDISQCRSGDLFIILQVSVIKVCLEEVSLENIMLIAKNMARSSSIEIQND
jgi:hypothetical protein